MCRPLTTHFQLAFLDTLQRTRRNTENQHIGFGKVIISQIVKILGYLYLFWRTNNDSFLDGIVKKLLTCIR